MTVCRRRRIGRALAAGVSVAAVVRRVVAPTDDGAEVTVEEVPAPYDDESPWERALRAALRREAMALAARGSRAPREPAESARPLP